MVFPLAITWRDRLCPSIPILQIFSCSYYGWLACFAKSVNHADLQYLFAVAEPFFGEHDLLPQMRERLTAQIFQLATLEPRSLRCNPGSTDQPVPGVVLPSAR